MIRKTIRVPLNALMFMDVCNSDIKQITGSFTAALPASESYTSKRLNTAAECW